ncbi:RNA polymerase sigma factor [Streptomyces sp. TRM68367]|uniref:RNA polymerase sigma factor n=1 Tax=Streptomyces sp. TRM68367 TaxID=2758415 RepID=UPI00165B3B62|nr:sigma-70 family RNA polymerase sigma factor [Streptomyces sp. TRM68367]MBC9725221.1 sigma-70 family RNA polymerase sigma factor [Streptomyces sp. TRM68367]
MSGTSAVEVERWLAVWQYRDVLLRAARRRTASTEDAEDAVQEAMVRAMEGRRIDDARLGAWLMSVTLRLCVDSHRDRVREQRRWARTSVSVPAVGVDEHVCDRAEAVWAADVVARLPTRQVRALRLRAMGLTVAEVAHRLGVNYRTAESLLARARKTVKAALASTLGSLVAWWRDTAGVWPTVVYSGVAAAAVTVVTVVPSQQQATDEYVPQPEDRYTMQQDVALPTPEAIGGRAAQPARLLPSPAASPTTRRAYPTRVPRDAAPVPTSTTKAYGPTPGSAPSGAAPLPSASVDGVPLAVPQAAVPSTPAPPKTRAVAGVHEPTAVATPVADAVLEILEVRSGG